MTVKIGKWHWLVVIIWMTLHYRLGRSMQCYSYSCNNFTNTDHPTCPPPKVITCPVDHRSLVPPNRCMIQRITAEVKGTVVNQEIRGCTDNLKCRSNGLCDQAKNHGNIKHCEVACCKGALCNREGPVPRHIVSNPMAPSGSDLSCYACSTANEPGLPPAINCSYPIKQQCGNDPLTNEKQDRCVTIMMSSRDPYGKIISQELRHCASGHYCSYGFCVNANVSGSLTSCKASCCYGNMCNNDGMTPAVASTLPPITTDGKNVVFARQGADSDFTTMEVPTTHTFGKCARNEMTKPLLLALVFYPLVF